MDVAKAIEQRSVLGEPVRDQHGHVVDWMCLICGLPLAAHDEDDDCDKVIQAAALVPSREA